MYFMFIFLILTSPPDLRVVFEKFEPLSVISSPILIRRPIVKIEERLGEMRCVVLLGEFSDTSFTITSPVNYFQEMFFREATAQYSLYPYPSMTEFYEESSGGRFWISGDVYGPYVVSNTHDCYGSGSCNDFPPCLPDQDAGTCRGALNFVYELVNLADGDVDFSKYDTNPADGFVDCLIAVHPGYGAEQSCGAISGCNDIWSLSYSFSSANSSPVSTDDGVSVDAFIVGPEKTMVPPETPIDVGVYAHEFGHILGLVDLYDPSFKSCGIGVYGLMGYGVHGPSPSYPCAWSRLKLGWAEVEEFSKYEDGVCRYEMKSILDKGSVLKLEKPGGSGDEYFLVEYRPGVGFDSDFGEGGFLIWHIDERMSSNSCAWYPGSNKDPSTCHYMVALEQADGLYQLERKEGKCNEVDPDDFYKEGDEFTPYTTPNSNYYDNSFSGIWVRNITTSPPLFTFEIGDSPMFSPPKLISTPSPYVILGRKYVYNMEVSGYPQPEIEIVDMPDGATFSATDYTFRWTPKDIGKYSFSVILKNCLGEKSVSWEVEVKPLYVESEGETPMCLIAGVIKDGRVLYVLRHLRGLLKRIPFGNSLVKGYYVVSKIILKNSILRIMIPQILLAILYLLPFFPYIFLFRLQKNLFRVKREERYGE